MINFKSPEIINQYQKIPPQLVAICNTLDFVAHQILGEEHIIITSIFRPKTTDSGIHSMFRAVDFAIFKDSGEEGTLRMAEIINAIYKYDYQRPAMQVANTTLYHGTAPHLHIQCHGNTSAMDAMHYKTLSLTLTAQKKNFVPLAGIA